MYCQRVDLVLSPPCWLKKERSGTAPAFRLSLPPRSDFQICEGFTTQSWPHCFLFYGSIVSFVVNTLRNDCSFLLMSQHFQVIYFDSALASWFQILSYWVQVVLDFPHKCVYVTPYTEKFHSSIFSSFFIWFSCRRRTEFFELVSKGDYDWNIKSHRDVFR